MALSGPLGSGGGDAGAFLLAGRFCFFTGRSVVELSVSDSCQRARGLRAGLFLGSCFGCAEVPMFSRQALEKLWYVSYEPRPQFLFELVLAVVVFTYAISSLCSFVYRRWRG